MTSEETPIVTEPLQESTSPQSPNELTTKQQIMTLHFYLKEKETWENEVLSEIQIAPQTPQYETYKGPRGDEVKKTAERIRKDILTEKEEAGVEAKKKGDEAFRAGNFEEAVGGYQQAIVYCHPHNAVCWSNMSAALLKLKRWSEAEKAAKMALREHASIHGWHTGMFHIKVYHRLGLANREMGRWEAAAQYFFKALEINPNNSAASDEAEATMALLDSRGYADRPPDYEGFKKLARERWEKTRSQEDSWASRITEDDFEILVGTGCMPWAEDVENQLAVSKGVKQMELPFFEVPEFRAIIDDAQMPGNHSREVERECNECRCLPGVAPHMFCPACYSMSYCSEVCAVFGWKAHKTYCYDNRIAHKTLPKGRAADAEMFKKIRKFDETRKQVLGQACFVALGLLKLESRYDFQTHAGVIFVKYDPDPKTPVKVLAIKKMSIPELEEKYPASFLPEGQSSLSQKRQQMDVESKKTGALGTAVCITIVEDGKWHSAMCAFFPVTKGFLDSAPTKGRDFEDGWEEYYVDALNGS
ncbi:hypothetical protein M407DRAFT_28865 [Tulasnella calospora MUT 4182]|uniref:MYND-type domain-containing protein n=1 Tax=Tulasnella calospora MUT 4182 TaxID=1051891 RepID=A0A0C3KJ91_9AGAM|nr:hypothetical protein M407DRAFT_28865 [Tulasnella calospora MUT 4182]